MPKSNKTTERRPLRTRTSINSRRSPSRSPAVKRDAGSENESLDDKVPSSLFRQPASETQLPNRVRCAAERDRSGRVPKKRRLNNTISHATSCCIVSLQIWRCTYASSQMGGSGTGTVSYDLAIPLVFPITQGCSRRLRPGHQLYQIITGGDTSDAAPAFAFMSVTVKVSKAALDVQDSSYVFLLCRERPVARDDTVFGWVRLMMDLQWLPLRRFCEMAEQRLDSSAFPPSAASWVLAEAYNIRRLGLGTPHRMALLLRSPGANTVHSIVVRRRQGRAFEALEELLRFLRPVVLDRHVGAPEPRSAPEVLHILQIANFNVAAAWNMMDEMWCIQDEGIDV